MPSEEFHDKYQESLRPGHQEAAAALGEIAAQADAEVPDTVWDHSKAETMAAVLQEPARVKSFSGRGPDVLYPFNSLYNKARYDVSEKERLNESEADGIERNINEMRDKLDDPEVSEAEKEYYREVFADHNEIQSINADRLLSPFVTLYDLNPEKFANMPTREFMDAAKKYDKLYQDIDQVDASLDLLRGTTEFYNKMLESSKGSPHQTSQLAAMAGGLIHGIDTLAASAYRDKLPEVGGAPELFASSDLSLSKLFEQSIDDFTMSPKDIIEKQLVILNELTKLGEESLVELNTKKQALEDEAKAALVE